MQFTDLHDDPETAVAARGLERMLRDRFLDHLQAFYDNRSSYPREWQEVTGGSEFILHLTPAELRALDEKITELLRSYSDRGADPALRPPGSLPVEVLLFGYPVRTPETEAAT